jgi:hypothetical protein
MNALSDLIALDSITVSGAFLKYPPDLGIVDHKGFESSL